MMWRRKQGLSVVAAALWPVALAWAAVEPAGEPVRGLALRAQVSATRWPLGAEVMFEATLTNVGREPLVVDLFGDVHELYQGKRGRGILPSCWALVFQPPAVAGSPRRGPYTLAPEQFQKLGPGESVTQRLRLVLSGVPPGPYEVKLAYVPRAAGGLFSFPDQWEAQQDFTDPMWIGMALSNPLTVEVVPAAVP
jgi:hypothetical protein